MSPASSLHGSLTLPIYFSTGESTQATYTLSKCSATEFTPAASLFLVFFLRSGYLMLFTSSYTYPHFLPQDLGPDWPLVFIPLFSVHTSPCLMALSQLSPPHCFGLSVPSIALLVVSLRLAVIAGLGQAFSAFLDPTQYVGESGFVSMFPSV